MGPDESTAQAGAHDVELARVLVPLLLERIEGATARIARVEAALAERKGEDEDLARELARQAREAEGLGWLLGWIAGGLGAELLLERHEPRALELALELVQAALERRGRGLTVSGVPGVSRSGGWRLAWGVAGLAWRAGSAQAAGSALELEIAWGVDSAHVGAAMAAGEALHTRARQLERELDGSQFSSGPAGWSWHFPAEWVEVPA